AGTRTRSMTAAPARPIVVAGGRAAPPGGGADGSSRGLVRGALAPFGVLLDRRVALRCEPRSAAASPSPRLRDRRRVLVRDPARHEVDLADRSRAAPRADLPRTARRNPRDAPRSRNRPREPAAVAAGDRDPRHRRLHCVLDASRVPRSAAVEVPCDPSLLEGPRLAVVGAAPSGERLADPLGAGLRARAARLQPARGCRIRAVLDVL